MSLPAFNALGLLPPGIHNCSLAMARNVFAYNIRREQLFESLQRCIAQMHTAGLVGSLLLDGSFVTDKANPGDIEVTLDVRLQTRDIQDKALLFFCREHQTLDAMGIDWYPTIADNASGDFTLYFQYVGEKTAATKRCQPKDRKGILRLNSW